MPRQRRLTLERMGAGHGALPRLFRAIGRDIMWFSRLIMAEETLAGIIGDRKSSALRW